MRDELRRKLGHADVRFCLHPADQHRHIRRRLACRAGAAEPVRHTLHKLDRATHANAKPLGYLTTLMPCRYTAGDPIPQVTRIGLPHDPPPMRMNQKYHNVS